MAGPASTRPMTRSCEHEFVSEAPVRLDSRRCVSQCCKILPQALACFGRKFDKYPPAVVRIRPAPQESFLDHPANPAESCGGRHGGPDAQARDRYAEAAEFRLQQIQHHVPGRIGEKLLGEKL